MSRKPAMIVCLLAAAVVGLGVLGIGAQRLQAQEAPAKKAQPTAVAVVNVAELISKSAKNSDFQKKMDIRRETLKAEATKKEKAINVMRADLLELPNAEARADKERQIIEAMANYQAWRQINESTLLRDQRVLLIELYDDIDKTVAKVAKRQGYELVLFDTPSPNFDQLNADQLVQAIGNRRVIYRTDRTNLTVQVLEQMNLDYKQ